jgi:hypothetical protein
MKLGSRVRHRNGWTGVVRAIDVEHAKQREALVLCDAHCRWALVEELTDEPENPDTTERGPEGS